MRKEIMGNFLFYIPHIFGVIIGFAMIVAAIQIKKENGSWDFSKYYQAHIEKSYKSQTKIEQLLLNSQVIMICSGWIIFFWGILGYIAVFLKEMGYYRVFRYVDEIIQQINQLNSLISWFGIVITVTVVLVAFKKKYYLVFSVEDVLDKYKYREKLFFLIATLVLVEIINVLILSIKFPREYKFAFGVESIILYCLALGVSIRMLYIVITIIFSTEHNELALLNNLYYKIKPMAWHSEVQAEVDDSALYMNIEYLIDQYSLNYKKIKAGDIKEIKCDNVFEEAINKVYNHILKTLCKFEIKYMLICVSVYFVFEFCLLSGGIHVIKEMLNSLIFSVVVWFACIGILALCGISKRFVPLKQLVNRLFMHDYFFKFKKEDKEFFVSIHDIGLYRKHAGFFKSVLNMVVFFKMLGSNPNTMQKMLNQIEKLYAYPSREDHLGKEQMYYFVMIYYSFLCYVQFEQPERKKIINRYKGKEWIDRLQNRVIRDLAIAMIKCTENEADKMIKKYDGFVKACVRS